MIRAKPDDFVRLPADALAQIMLQCASDDPTLVKRSRSPAKSVQVHTKLPPDAQQESGSPLALLSNSDRATKQYLEDLVSIAVASAERADDVLNQANATRRKANRAVWAFASVAAVGVVVGSVGIVSSRSGNATDGKLTEIASEVRSLSAQQELTNHQFAVVRSDVADEHEAATAVQEAATPARPDTATSKAEAEPQVAVVPQSQPNVTAPVSPVQQATYSSSVWPQRSRPEQPTTYQAPWPQHTQSVQPTTYSSPWPQHTQPVWSARHRQQPTVPQFLVVIQQNLRALFR
jgi:outer membrane murein-binding lipoprotein Lpp